MRVLLVTLALCSSACWPDEEARSAVLKAGYREVRVVWTPLSECPGASTAHDFSALDKEDSYVHGVVCCEFSFGCVVKLR